MSKINESVCKAAFDETVDAIVVTDGATGKIVNANKACCQLLNCEKQKIIGTNLLDYLDQKEILSTSKSPKDISMFGSVLPNRNLKTPSGEMIPVDLTINTFKGESSHLVMTSMRDVRERVKYENQIIRMNKELQELNANKDKLFSIIAHDLKNPLMALMGLSELLTGDDDELTPDELSEMAGSINKLSKDTYELLDNLLSWAQVQTDRMQVDRKIFDLSVTVSSVIDVLNPSAELKKIKLVNSVPSATSIIADENMIKTIIRNLVSNSIKFSGENSCIFIKNLDTEKQNIIVVEDHGVGMEKEYLDNLFKIDVQTTRPGTKKEKGTGLGLLICSEFAKLHSGEIKVVSEVGKGTQFFIHLPK